MDFQEAIQSFPQPMRGGLALAYQTGGEMAREMFDRGEMDPKRALMVGLALDPRGRPMFEDALESQANVEADLPPMWPEVIVGSGAHAAIYAAVRFKLGSTPLVLEKNERFGGTFAITKISSFYLNSRNRPGPLGTIGSRDALNFLPGAPMQPADLSGAEYQANADLGLVIRSTLAMNAVIRRARVAAIARNGDDIVVVTNRGNVRTKRVVIATGLGLRLNFGSAPYDGEKMISYEQFMRRFDKTAFPLRGLGRVAVIGGGDSGKTVIEALTGYGPYMGGSVASLDYVEQIDWYGLEQNMTKERWIECNRTRYKPLGALFPSNNGLTRNARVRSLGRAQNIYKAFDAMRIGGEAYDTIICCRGFAQEPNSAFDAKEFDGTLKTFRSRPETERGTPLGLANDERSVVVVGPAAQLPYEAPSDGDQRVPENDVALFRLAPRTAGLAGLLPTFSN